MKSGTAAGTEIEDNIISKNSIQARFDGINLNFTATCGTYQTASRNILSGNIISGVLDANGVWDLVDHAIYPQKSTLTQITGNVIRRSINGVNFQQCPQENTVLDNQVEATGTGIIFNGSGIASKNMIQGATTGISADWSTYTALTDNMFSLPSTSRRYYLEPSRVYHSTIRNNCDIGGNCEP